jgi:hypothetical protein
MRRWAAAGATVAVSDPARRSDDRDAGGED